MDDDDDWGLSFEELDSLERDAAVQFASRSKASGSLKKSIPDVNFGSSSKNVAASQPSCISSCSPSKNVGVASSNTFATQSPSKKSGKGGLKVKVFKDQPGRIAVESSYHPDAVAALRTISGKSWDKQRKVWTFPEGELEDVVRAMSSLSQIQVTIDVEPSLSERTSGLLQGPSAERNNLQEEEADISSTPPQPTSLQGNHDGVVLCIDSQKGLLPQSSEDGGWKSPKTGKFESSHNGGSNQPSRKKCAVSLFLHGSGKIAAKFDYDSQLVASFRKIPRSEWYAKERLWMFPFSSLVEAENILSNVSDRSVQVEPLVPLVKRALADTACLPDLQERYDCVPGDLKRTLMDFQVDGVRFALQHGGRALIADEMGLGKTLQMVEKWLKIDPSDITILMSQGSSREGFNIVRSTGKQQVHLDGLFNIVSYDSLSKLEEAILTAKFRIVIADESHYMKNPSAKRTNACVPLLQKAKYALLLTGTPALSRPIEMFKQLEALQPDVYKRMDEYGRRYCMGGFFGVWQGASNQDELHALVKSTVMIRRLKKDVMTQLPKKRREQVFISLDDKGGKVRDLKFQLAAAKKEHKTAIHEKDTEESNRLNFLERQLLSQLYTESAEAKLPAVKDYLATILEAGCKFLVFGHHQNMLDGIQELLEKKKVNFIRIDGKTAASSRQDLVKKFQEKPDVLVALLGIRAAGVGLTLTAASTVIFAEMSWTPGDLVQAEDRVHRIGQESAVNVYYLHARESVDDLIWDSVQQKLENLGQVLDGEDSSMKVAFSSNEHGGSQGQTTLDPYLLPCANTSAEGEVQTVHNHVAEVMSSSQAQATVDAFLRPFEIRRAPSSGVEGFNNKRKRVFESGRGHWPQPRPE